MQPSPTAISNNIVTLKYVDDMTLIERTIKDNVNNNMQQELNELERWTNNNHMQLNPTKCLVMNVSFMKFKPHMQPLSLCNEPLHETDCVKILGVHITSDLKWDVQVNDMLKRANGRLYMLKVLQKFGLSVEDLITVYVGYIRPLAEYAAPVWHPGLNDKQSISLERIQKRAFKIILGQNYLSYDNALKKCNISTLYSCRDICHTFASSLFNSNQFHQWLPSTRGDQHNRGLRNSNKLTIPKWLTKRYLNSPIPFYVKLLNAEA